jgi:hypothetical protein
VAERRIRAKLNFNLIVSQFNKSSIMGRDDNCCSAASVTTEGLPNGCGGGMVEITGWFVREDDRWLVDQRSTKRDSLSLASTYLAWLMLFPLSDAESFKEGQRTLLSEFVADS